MISQNSRIRDLVPSHYLSEFPNFVRFLETYYEWQYRDVVATPQEQGDNVTINKAPGAISKGFQQNHLLERVFSVIQTADGFGLQDVDAKQIETPDTQDLRIQEWVSDQGHYLPSQNIGKHKIDEILFTRLIKSMHLIKGTPKATELFFHLFFNEDISKNNPYENSPQWNPREAITTIDNIVHKIDNIDNQMRNDDFFNEFSYAIYVKRDYGFYKDLFENVYLKYIHPAGFKAFLITI